MQPLQESQWKCLAWVSGCRRLRTAWAVVPNVGFVLSAMVPSLSNASNYQACPLGESNRTELRFGGTSNVVGLLLEHSWFPVGKSIFWPEAWLLYESLASFLMFDAWPRSSLGRAAKNAATHKPGVG